MNPTRWCLLLLLIPITIAGQQCTNAWSTTLQAVAASDSGKVFAAISRHGVRGTEIWQWSSDLSKRESLWRVPSQVQGLQTDRGGSIVICQTIRGLSAYDTQRRQKLWTTVPASTCKCLFVGYDRYLLLVEVEHYDACTLTLFDAGTGSEIDRIAVLGGAPNRKLRQIYFDKNHATLEFHGGQLARYTSVNNRIQLVDDTAEVGGLGSAGKLFELLHHNRRKLAPPSDRDSRSEAQDVVITPRSTHDPATICVVDRQTGEVLHQDRLGLSTAVVSLVACAVALASVIWVMMLINDGLSSRNPWRVVIDLGILSVFFTLPYIAGLGDLVPENIVDSQPRNILAIPLAVFCSSLFLLLLGTDRPFHFWSMILVGCFFPFLLPVPAAMLILRLGRFQSPLGLRAKTGAPIRDRRKLRFGIAEMLLATAALAALFGMGASILFLVPMGIGYAVVLFVGVLLSLDRTCASTTVCLCSLGITFSACVYPALGAWIFMHLLMTALTFSFLRVHGYAVERESFVSAASH